MQDLNDLRAQIDDIDQQLIKLLAKRFSITNSVGEYKKIHKLPPIDPSREKLQFAKIEALAEQHGLDPLFAHAMLRLIIDAVVINHQKIQSDQN